MQENSSLLSLNSSLTEKEWNEIKSKLSGKFDKMMKGLFRQKGAQLDISILASDEAQSFIQEHASILDSTFQKVKMSDKMRERLTRSNYIFSGIKTFHELNEAFPSLLDENGDRKPFEKFLNDVRKIDETYNANYLHSEYNFVHQSAQMAAKWEQFAEDGDRYYLQYRTAHDDKVRPEHAALEGVTLPMSDPFWETYYPPNGWNCRCTVAQVRKQKYTATPHQEAMDRGKEALDGERYNIFRFNSGKQEKTMPDYNPYTIRRCSDCDVAKGGSTKLVAHVPDCELCSACQIVRKMNEPYTVVETKNGKVRTHSKHGKSEKRENIRIASYFANKYGDKIDLLPQEHRKHDADTYNKTHKRKEEYKTNGVPTKNAIDLLIRKGGKQAKHVVLAIESGASLNTVKEAIIDRVRRTENIQGITVLLPSSGEYPFVDATYSREQMLRNDFKIKPEDFS